MWPMLLELIFSDILLHISCLMKFQQILAQDLTVGNRNKELEGVLSTRLHWEPVPLGGCFCGTF